MALKLCPQIERFASEPCDELSSQMAADIIGCNYDTVRRLCMHGQIEHSAMTHARGRGNNRRVWITKAALLAYLVKSTHGPREVLLHAINQRCPEWHQFACHIAAGLPLHSADAARQGRPAKSSGGNIIDLRDHPEFPFTSGLNPEVARAS